MARRNEQIFRLIVVESDKTIALGRKRKNSFEIALRLWPGHQAVAPPFLLDLAAFLQLKQNAGHLLTLTAAQIQLGSNFAPVEGTRPKGFKQRDNFCFDHWSDFPVYLRLKA